MEQEYILRLYDTDLLTFSLSEHGIEGLKAKIHEINQAERNLFPLDMELSDAGLLKWLRRRVIPKNRAYVAEILKTFGLSVNDTKGIIDVCKGLSLNDSFWVVPHGFAGTCAQYNLYENRFSEILSLVAYTGIGQSDAAPDDWKDLDSYAKTWGRAYGISFESICREVMGRFRESSYSG